MITIIVKIVLLLMSLSLITKGLAVVWVNNVKMFDAITRREDFTVPALVNYYQFGLIVSGIIYLFIYCKEF